MRKVVIVLCAILAHGNVLAGQVKGVVATRDDKDKSHTSAKDFCFWRLGPAALPAGTGSAMVVLEGPAAETAPAPPATTIELQGYGFWPPVVVVSTGAVVTFKNRDSHPYSCTASEGPNAFQIEQLKPGATHNQKFIADGVVEVRCQTYPFMRGTIVVVNSPLWAAADDTGKFQFNNVPAGDYQARAFVQGAWRWKSPVKVPAQGAVQLALGPTTAPGGDSGQDKNPSTGQGPTTASPGNVPPTPGEGSAAAKNPDTGDKTPPTKAKPGGETGTTPGGKPGGEKKPSDQTKAPNPGGKQPGDKKQPKKPGSGETEPAFKDVEPEIEIEVE